MNDVPAPPQLPPADWVADSRPGGPKEHAPTAVAALVFGILGLTFLPVIGSIVALVFGYQSRNAARAEPDRYDDQLGQVGRILGWVGVALTVAGLLLVVVVSLFFLLIGAGLFVGG